MTHGTGNVKKSTVIWEVNQKHGNSFHMQDPPVEINEKRIWRVVRSMKNKKVSGLEGTNQIKKQQVESIILHKLC